MTRPSPWSALLCLANRQGSTRALGLMRMGMAALLWSRFGSELTLFRHQTWPFTLAAALLFTTTPLMFVGLFSRVTTAINAALAVFITLYIGTVVDHEPYRHHHTTLLALLAVILAFAPTGRSLSVDRYLAVRKAQAKAEPAPEETGPQWTVTLLALQLSAVYLFSALDKLHVGWLSGERMQAILLSYYGGPQLPTAAWFEPACMLMGAGAVLLELSLGLGLWSKRLRPALVPLGLLFHLTIYATLPVLTFSSTMAVFYLAYADPSAVHSFLDTLLTPGTRRSPA